MSEVTKQHKMRFEYVDGIRGYLIFAMTVGHVGAVMQSSDLSWFTHKPWTVFLSGEGFMLISGFMTGFVICRKFEKGGNLKGVLWALSRSLKIVLYYLGVLTLCAAPMIFLEANGTFAARLFYSLDIFRPDNLLLFAFGVYRPTFFDILHLYVFYIALAPVFLIILFSRFWWVCVTLCTLLWLLTQYGVTLRATQSALNQLPELQIDYMGAFHFFGWQFLFFLGCAIGGLLPHTRTKIQDTVHKVDIVAVDIAFASLLGFVVFRALQASGVLEQHATYGADYLVVAPLPLLNFALVVFLITVLLCDAPLERSRFSCILVVLRSFLRWFFLLAPLRIVGAVTLQSFSVSIVFSYWLAYMMPVTAQVGFWNAFASLGVVTLGVYVVSVLFWIIKKRPVRA